MTTARGIAVVTGTRAEFGLLRPVMDAIESQRHLSLHVIATGTHLLPPDETITEVRSHYRDVYCVEMHRPGHADRIDDAIALGRGVSGIASTLHTLDPAVVLVLGDRIEALAGACAASIGGFMLAHMHGGDRAEGIADEAMRHAITKLAHVHLPATEQSAQRIIRMGEDADSVHVVGSPAIDGLNGIAPLNDERFEKLGQPEIVFLMHPLARDTTIEQQEAAMVLGACMAQGPTVALHPNHDPGRGGIINAINDSGVVCVSHLPRAQFIGLLKRARMIVGNSSAGLIECAALEMPCVNVGRRQDGRERGPTVIDVHKPAPDTLQQAITTGLNMPRHAAPEHPYGDGHTGPRTAALLGRIAVAGADLPKRNSY